MLLFASSLAGVIAHRIQFFQRRSGLLLLALGVGFLGLALLWLAWCLGLDLSALKHAWLAAESFLSAHPWYLFLALVALPGLPVPTSALMLLAGLVWRETPWMACSICLFAMMLNMSWTYALAAGPGRKWVERLLLWRGIPVPILSPQDQIRWVLLLRLTPGVPLFLQNYLLGFMRIPFGWYLLISIPCNGMVAVGVVLSGAGIADGKWTSFAAGIGLVVVSAIGVQVLRKKLKAKRA